MSQEQNTDQFEIEKKSRLEKAIEGLKPSEATAMQVFMRGGSITHAAIAANVARNTIHTWLKEGHPLAKAVLLWKRDLATTARTRLLIMTEVATANVAQSLQKGDVRTALRLLEKLGILASPAVGTTTAEIRHRKQTARTLIVENDAAKVQANNDLMRWLYEKPRPGLLNSERETPNNHDSTEPIEVE